MYPTAIGWSNFSPVLPSYKVDLPKLGEAIWLSLLSFNECLINSSGDMFEVSTPMLSIQILTHVSRAFPTLVLSKTSSYLYPNFER